MSTSKIRLKTGDRIKFTGKDSNGVINEGGHYIVVHAFTTHVVALFENTEDFCDGFVLLDTAGCKKRRFRND